MAGKRPKAVVSYNMSRIRSEGTKLEMKLEELLKSIACEYVSHPKMFGKPDFVYPDQKVAIFADSDFWHGFQWVKRKREIKTNKQFWIQKIERNIARDEEVTSRLSEEGWRVLRLWGHDILWNPNKCQSIIAEAINADQSKCKKHYNEE